MVASRRCGAKRREVVLLGRGVTAIVECRPAGQTPQFGSGGMEATTYVLAISAVPEHLRHELKIGMQHIQNAATPTLVIHTAANRCEPLDLIDQRVTDVMSTVSISKPRPRIESPSIDRKQKLRANKHNKSSTIHDPRFRAPLPRSVR